MYYQDDNTEHHNIDYPPYQQTCQILGEKHETN